ncbi:MAG: hypothetical protein AB4038_05130 [Prochloraceae cyanobacterium]
MVVRKVADIIEDIFSQIPSVREGKISELVALGKTSQREDARRWIKALVTNPPDPRLKVEDNRYLVVDGVNIPLADERYSDLNEDFFNTFVWEVSYKGNHPDLICAGIVDHLLKEWQPRSDAFTLTWEVLLKNENELKNRYALIAAIENIIFFGEDAQQTQQAIKNKLISIATKYNDEKEIVRECRASIRTIEMRD